MPSPRALMLADLARSGLDADDAKVMRLEPWEPAKTAEHFPHAGAAPSYKIPYPGSKCYRIRALAPPPLPFGAVPEKWTRYWQPPKTAPAVYLPAHVPDWGVVRASAEQPLIIVEGEKKAARVAKTGRPCVGLGGVWSFGSKAAGQAMLPELRAFTWERRHVFICFDSDASENPQIVRAICRLSALLTDQGAVVHVATMPRIGQTKVGIDDFLEARGEAALAEHLTAAPMGDSSAKLWEMNERYGAIINPPCVVDVQSRELPPPIYSVAQFTGLVVANEHIRETYVTAGGDERTRDLPLGKAWLEFSARRQHSSMTYAPGQPRVTADGRLNNWLGLGVEPRKGDIKPWRELLDHLFQGAPRSARLWFERWCGYPLKHPGTKLQSAVGLWSVHTGVGKSLVARTLGAVYGDNYLAIDQDDLESDFNQWALYKQLVLVDEVSAADTRKRADKFKKLISQDRLWVNLKGVKQFPLPDYVNYILTSNHANAFYVEDDDRRFFIHRVEVTAKPRAFYDHYCYEWLGLPKPNGAANVQGPSKGAAALLHYFLNELDYGDFHPAERPPVTAAKTEMMEGVRSPVDAWLADAPSLPLFSTRDLYTAAELCLAYNASGNGRYSMAPNAFALHVSRRFKKTRGGFFALRNERKWADASQKACQGHHDAAQKL